jgi:hypothetical protein
MHLKKKSLKIIRANSCRPAGGRVIPAYRQAGVDKFFSRPFRVIRGEFL